MPTWKVKGKDYTLWYKVDVNLKKLDELFYDWVPRTITRHGKTITVSAYEPLVDITFLNKQSAKAFYNYLANKTRKEQRHIVIAMVKKHYKHILKVMAREERVMKRLEE